MRPPRKPTGGSRPPSGSPFRPSAPAGSGPRAPGRPARPGADRPDRPQRDRPDSDRPRPDRGFGDRPARPSRRGEAPALLSRPPREDDRSRDRRDERDERPARPGRPNRDAARTGDRATATGRAPRREDDAHRPPRPVRGRAGAAPRGQRATDRQSERQTDRAGERGPRARPPLLETQIAPQRVAKALARAGVGSRRDIERMVAEGRIAINGDVLTSPAHNIETLNGITVDGEPVAGIAPTRLYRFHKPAGFLTAARDPAGRPTIMDILPPDLPRVVPVGRLDMNTEGLLLLTTDGELKRALELPSSSVPRVYRVRAFGEVSQRALESLADGATIDGIHYGPILADIERRTGQNLWLIVTIREGKNREVRRVLEHIGLQVNRLIRIAYGPIGLDDLPPRAADEIPESDLQLLKAMLKASKTEVR